MMRSIGCMLVLGTVLAAGCDNGSDVRPFTINSIETVPLEGVCGGFVVVHGNVAARSSMSSFPKPLLFMLVVAPGLEGSGGSKRTEAESMKTTIQWECSNAGAKIDAALSWDRAKDMVEVEGRQFRRSDGQAFVFVRTKDGGWDVRQVAVDVKGLADRDALVRVQQSLPADSPAKSVKSVAPKVPGAE